MCFLFYRRDPVILKCVTNLLGVKKFNSFYKIISVERGFTLDPKF